MRRRLRLSKIKSKLTKRTQERPLQEKMRTTADRPYLRVRMVKLKLKVAKAIAGKQMVSEAKVQKGKIKRRANLEKESEVNLATADDKRDTKDPEENEAEVAAAVAAVAAVEVGLTEAEKGKEAAVWKR